jgi:hypothetical protein
MAKIILCLLTCFITYPQNSRQEKMIKMQKLQCATQRMLKKELMPATKKVKHKTASQTEDQ